MDKSAWPFAQWGLTDDELKRMKEEIRLHPPMAITVSSGEITQITPIYQDRAIEILREMVEFAPVRHDDNGRDWCLFCVEQDCYHHEDNCPWLRAKQLLEEIDNGRT